MPSSARRKEKVPKAFLTLRQVRFERRHDLNYLIDLCAPLDAAFEQLRAEADELTPYAVEYRYPDALPLLSLDAARSTVQTATRIYTFVLAHLRP